MAGCVASDLSRRARLRVQMEHGLDARLPRVHEPRPDLSPLSSRQYHFLFALRIPGKFHSRTQPRRSRARQTLALIKDAGRRMAEVCKLADVLRLDVRPAGEKAALHGWRARAAERMEPRYKPRLEFAGVAATRRAASFRAASQLHLQKRTGIMAAGRQLRGFRMD